MQQRFLFRLLAISLALVACTEPSDVGTRISTCVPGSTAFCACVGGVQGVQECRSDGTFAACVCPSADGGSIDAPYFDVQEVPDTDLDAGDVGDRDDPALAEDTDPLDRGDRPDLDARDTGPETIIVVPDVSLDVVSDSPSSDLPDDGREEDPASSTPGIRVILTWVTPSDDITNDSSGSDVDLHFMREGGEWNTVPDDCFYLNLNPSWGEPGTEDDPSLDIDVVTGWGPEIVTLYEPQGTEDAPTTYSVGVFYYSDHLYGPSDCTVRIYLDGVERYEKSFDGLTDLQFWDVARIVWPTREIEPIDTLYPSGFP